MNDDKQLTRVPQYKWADEVKKLYDFTCVNCGKTLTGRLMHAHHIIPRHQDEELSNALENGVALCYFCHRYGIHDGCGNIGDSQRAKDIIAKINNIKDNEIILTIPKGKKEIIKAYAESKGKSINSYINDIINEAMEKEK